MQAHEAQRLVDALAAHLARQVIELRKDQQVLIAGQLTVGGQGLRYVADDLPDLRRLRTQVQPLHLGAAAARRQQGGEHFDQRTLACAIAPQQAEHLPLGHREADVVYGQVRAKAPCERLAAQGNGRGRRKPRRIFGEGHGHNPWWLRLDGGS